MTSQAKNRRVPPEVIKLGALGFVASIVVTLTSAMRGWPFARVIGTPWIFQITNARAPEKYAFLVLFVGAMVALCVAWLRSLSLGRSGVLSGKAAFALFLLWSAPLMVATPLFSGDVFVYAITGDLMMRGYDLYTAGVSAIGATPQTHLVYPFWRGTRTPYGPLFMRITQGVAWITDSNITASILIIRGLIIAALAASAAAAASLSRRFGLKPGEAIAFALLNPLTLLHIIGGVHNDGLSLSLLVIGLAVGAAARSLVVRSVAIAFCVTAAAIKVPAFAGVLLLGWMWAGAGASWKRRFTFGAVAGTVGIVMFELLTLATGLGWGWTKALSVPGLAHPLLAPANALGYAIGGIDTASRGTNNVTRDIAEGLSVVLAVFFVVRLGKHATTQQVVRAGAWALLAIAWLGPAVYPWYLVPTIVILGTTGAGRLHKLTVGAVIVTTFGSMPGGYGMLDQFTDWRRTILSWVCVAVFAWAARRCWTLNRRPVAAAPKTPPASEKPSRLGIFSQKSLVSD